MGVPKFYRWLSERYPSVNQMISDLSLLPEYDNLYLDMNGIIHACTHPNDQDVSQTLTHEEMMKNIWNYVDRMVTQIVKPKKFLFIAVDGVAPRAKMNQQRSRRFRSAKDLKEARADAEKKGVVINEDLLFDSNVITPGTEFMDKVDRHLQYFIAKKMKEDPLWRNLRIEYSGHAVPGEGEHKIMQWIRDARASPSYEANLRHCMYGQDADLIMLALATHEPHFTLLREVVDFGRGRTGGRGAARAVIKQTKDATFQLLHISLLREYLEYEFLRNVPEEVRDVERIVDDFVFLTFLVGNDFLPHLPSLDISEHAFDRLFEIYGNHFRNWAGKGYLTNKGQIDAERLQGFFAEIGAMEDDIFAAREEDVADFNKRRRKNEKRFGQSGNTPSVEELEAQEAAAQARYDAAIQEAVAKGEVPPEVLGGGGGGGGGAGSTGQEMQKKNFRGRYYYEKLKVINPNDSEVLRNLCKAYVEGLAWCLEYYVHGCVSWTWFYPFHYGPLISDVNCIAETLASLRFEIGEPFRPFEQLLGCLPADSATSLPRRYQFLMMSPTSPIIDFYPREFTVDMNGKHNPWEGVVLIPFIDETRLREAIRIHCPDSALSADEKRRNSFGKIITYVYDPSVSVTFPSCNPAIFPDIAQSQTRIGSCIFTTESLTYFEPRLVPGTITPSPGFPSLKVLPIQDVKIEPIKINVHGTESRYRTICLTLPVPDLPDIDVLAPEILGGRVYVNWPMMHETRITAITDGEVEFAIGPEEGGEGEKLAVHTPSLPAGQCVWKRSLSLQEQEEWDELIDTTQKQYLYGRGVVGSGGLDVGCIVMMLKVRPLQGMERDPVTGATKKVFGRHEAQVPIQLAMWSVPTADPRFIERGPVPLEERMPPQSDVVFLDGQYKGQCGSIVGYGGADGNRSVKVQVTVSEPDPPIGLLARNTFRRKYYEPSEVVRVLKIDGRILGKITGSIMFEPGKVDLGLNLKVRGKYVLPDYVRRKTVEGAEGANAWAQGVDSVRIVGSADADGGNEDGTSLQWEYSEKAVLLIHAYMEAFPQLFERVKQRPNEPVYEARQIFGPTTFQAELDKVATWLSQQETAAMPRIPLTTQILPVEAIRAIERSSNELNTRNKKLGNRLQVRTIEMKPEQVFACNSQLPSDAPRRMPSKPELGDRVVNLSAQGVPFGLRGTVVACHKHSACVEVLFDEEFIGGTSLQGTCAAFRGKLLPWSTLLKTTAEPPGQKGGRASTNGSQQVPLSALIKQKRVTAAPAPAPAPASSAPVQIKIRINPASLFQKPAQGPAGAPSATGKKPTSGIPIPGLAQATSGIPIPDPNAASGGNQAGQMLLAHLLRGGANGSSPPSSSTMAQTAEASVASPKVKPEPSVAISSPVQAALPGPPGESGGGGASDAKPVRKPLALVRRGDGLGDINAFGGVVMAKGPDKDKTDRGFKLKRSAPVPYTPPPPPVPPTASSPPPASGSDAMKRVMQLLRTKSTGSEGADQAEAPAPAPVPIPPQAVEVPQGPSSPRAGMALHPVTAGQAIKSLLRINGAAPPTTATTMAPPHPSSSPPPGPQAPPVEAVPPPPMPMHMPGYPPHMVMPPPYGFSGYPMGAMPMGGAFPRGGPMPPAPPPQAYMYYPPPYGQQPGMPFQPQASYMAPPQPVGGAVPRRAKKTDAAGRGTSTSSMMMPSQVLRMNKAAAPAAVSGPEPEQGKSDPSGGATQG